MNIDPEKRQKLLLFGALAGLGILLGDRLVLSPLLAAWDRRSEEIAALQKRVDQGRQLVARQDAVRAGWTRMTTNALPKVVSAAEGRVLSALDRWSRAANVNVTSVKPQWKQTEEDHMTFECHVDATGSLSMLTRFLYEVERDPLAVRVEAVELAARDNDASQLTLGLQVSGLLLNAPSRP